MRSAVIIGSGLGGLATALRLAHEGWNVTVCERGNSFGGKMNVWEQDGFRFDTGPSLITMPWIFADLFAACGTTIDEHIELMPMEPLANYIFADGTAFTYSTKLPEWLDVIRNLERRDVDGFLRFMKLGARLFALSRETFLRRPPFAPPDGNVIRALRHLPIRHGWGNYHATVADHFHNPLLRQMFDRYPTYVGSSPYLSPATLAVIPYIEFAFGGWHIKGGLYKLVQALVGIARNSNVELLANAQVEKIDHQDGRVESVLLADGTRLKADVVVMNGDTATSHALLGDDKRVSTEGRSLSAFVLLVGIRNKLEGLAHHSVFFSANYRQEFQQLFDERRFPDDPTVYVSAPSRSDLTVAPPNCESIFIMANSPANASSWGAEESKVARERILTKLQKSGFPKLEFLNSVTDEWSPQRIEHAYLSPGGAIYGTNSHGWRNAFMRPSNQHRKIGGLYFVGGSSHPGGGTPTVLRSAEISCGLIKKHES